MEGPADSKLDELSAFVFKELADKIPSVKSGCKKRLTRFENLAVDIIASYELRSRGNMMMAMDVAKLAEAHAAKLSQKSLTPEQLKRLRDAFDAEYVGVAHIKLYIYLARCWNKYRGDRTAFLGPYGALMQSSGSGKSRVVREVAKMTKKDDPNTLGLLEGEGEAQVSMRVLYVCARDNQQSTGFPVATQELNDFFFRRPVTEKYLTQQLLKTFSYAQSRWGKVGDEWFDLFTHPEADKRVAQAMAAPEARRDDDVDAKQQQRLLVIVIDEACALFNVLDEYGVSLFRLLRRALREANQTLAEQNYYGGIFALLTDTNSKVHDFIPSKHNNDRSSRAHEHEEEKILLPPFVLLQTVDVFYKSLGEVHCKKAIIEDNSADRWASLLSMGRPLWKTFVNSKGAVRIQQETVSQLAASKLLLGQPIRDEASYNGSTMFGAAALLCRLGLRPHSCSELSTRVVADFMGVLDYVSFTNDSHITSYPPEPVLAFGAARLWYQLQSSNAQKLTALEKFILPYFQEQLMQRIVDVGDAGEVAGRIFLLLAMDAAVMTGAESEGFVFSGQFCSVRKFLEILGGPAQQGGRGYYEMRDFYNRPIDGESLVHKEWMDKWDDWKVGFTQFVDLPEEPTEETLWMLLSRHAAGVFRRMQAGSDLVVPIFSGETISLILVQVKNLEKDKQYPVSASSKLYPSYVFTEANPLSTKRPCDVISIYISLRQLAPMPAQIYMDSTTTRTTDRVAEQLADANELNPNGPPAYTLCLWGVLTGTPSAWSFLSPTAATWLEKITNAAWWDIEARVRSDLERRDNSKFGKQASILSKAEVLNSLRDSMAFKGRIDKKRKR